MTQFSLDNRLAQDSIEITNLSLCQIRWMNNQLFPWILLIPKVPNVQEIIDLSNQEQVLLMQEIGVVSRILKEITSCDKLNVAALGNIVPQLHIHIIARFTNDVAWPSPIWGKGSKPYDKEERERWIRIVQELLSKYEEQ